MRGYELSLPNGDVETVEASSYEVDDFGGIEFKLDARTVHSRESGEWIGVQEFGDRLTTDWPTPRLENVLYGIQHYLAVTLGYYVHRVGPAHKYRSEAFNDLDALSGAILTDVGIDPRTTDVKQIAADVREAVAAAFDVDVPHGRIRSSNVVTSICCPKCGHALWTDLGALRCPASPMTFSPDVIQALRDYCSEPPADGAEQVATSVWEGIWFCPEDGARLTNGVGLLPHCFSCHRALSSDLIRQLDKLHGPYSP